MLFFFISSVTFSWKLDILTMSTLEGRVFTHGLILLLGVTCLLSGFLYSFVFFFFFLSVLSLSLWFLKSVFVACVQLVFWQRLAWILGAKIMCSRSEKGEGFKKKKREETTLQCLWIDSLLGSFLQWPASLLRVLLPACPVPGVYISD